LLVEGKLGAVKIGRVFGGRFPGCWDDVQQPQSNSYVFRRVRCYAQVAFDSGWSYHRRSTCGALATETRKEIINRQENTPMVIDHQYSVGFTWARQYGFRVVKNFNDKFALGFSVEGPQTTIGGRGFSAYTAASGTVSQNFWLNAPGSSGGLFNAFDPTGYTTNKAPDFIVKAALDPGWGHYEVFGIVSEFRNRIYPCAVVSPLASTGTPGTAGSVTLVGPALSCTASTATTPSVAGAF
jgi:hypothetical protein